MSRFITTVILTLAFSILLVKEANAGATINKPPLSLGLISGLVGYWSFDGKDMGNQKPRIGYGAFGVDLAGRAPASLGANAKMLLHTPQAQAHGVIVNKKSPFFKGFLL